MIRGDLVAFPPPRVHLDWRALYHHPTRGLGALLWRIALRWDMVRLMIKLLRQDVACAKWVDRSIGRFCLELVVIGKESLQDALRSRLASDHLWIAGTVRFESMAQWRHESALVPRLVETIVPEGVDAPLEFVPFRGVRHMVGEEV